MECKWQKVKSLCWCARKEQTVPKVGELTHLREELDVKVREGYLDKVQEEQQTWDIRREYRCLLCQNRWWL